MMSRNFVAFGMLALAGMLVLPEPAGAAGKGFGGGFGGQGQFRGGFGGQFRAPLILNRHHPRAGILRSGRPIGLRPAVGSRPHGGSRPAVALPLPGKPKLQPGPVRTTLADPWSRMHRKHHRRHFTGWIYPVTIGDDVAYFGVPYGPAETIPVYAPYPAAEESEAEPAPPRLAPRLTNAGPEGQEACRSERVTVPATEGEREITVVRC